MLYSILGAVYKAGDPQPQAHFNFKGLDAILGLSPDGKNLYVASSDSNCRFIGTSCSIYFQAYDRQTLASIGAYTLTFPVSGTSHPRLASLVASNSELFLNFRSSIVRVPLTALGFPPAPVCAANEFSISPNPVLSNTTSTTIKFSGTVGCPYDIHSGSPSGPVLATGSAGKISAPIDTPVSNGETFYLQRADIGSSDGTLASVSFESRDPLVASCVVSQFSINPSPIFSDSTYGVATLAGNIGCGYDIRINSPDGALFASGDPGQFSVTTGNWVSDNLVFYLQARGYQTSSGTLATAIAKVRPTASASCTASNFGSNPNPIRTNEPLASTLLTGTVNCAYDIRVGSPNGALFTSGYAGTAAASQWFTSDTAATISAQTGNWVTDGMKFFLQKAGDSTDGGTLAVFTAKFQPLGSSSCSVHGFTANPNPIYGQAPTGISTLVGSSDCAYDIRIGAPDGSLFTSGGLGNISAQTGNWVTDGMTFYLQAQNDTTSQGTLALVAAHVSSATSPSCTASGFATKDSPIRTNSEFGTTTLIGNTDCAYDIRVGRPDGALFASGDKGTIGAQTGNWVNDGMLFYLQPSGSTDSAATLAVATAKLQRTGPSCTVNGFTANPIAGTGGYGATTLVGAVGCSYDIRVGSPDGALFASGLKGSISAQTGDWVTDGMLFYLQLSGSTTADGTLAVAKAYQAQ
jgi:hypothetical protein